MRVDQCFNIKKGDIITFTGGGGKTSLIFALAKILSNTLKVLITTTTKIYTPKEEDYDILILSGQKNKDGIQEKLEIIKGTRRNISILGESIDTKTGKMLGIRDEILEKYKDEYDCILIEGDGSNGKPLKFWNNYDPVISKFSTKIVAVTNLDALGKKVSEVAHRYTELCEKYKWDKDRVIDIADLGDYILNGDFFKGSNDIEKIIFINGIEGLSRFNSALELGNLLRYNNRSEEIILGSFGIDEFYPYKKVVATLLASGFSRRFKGDKLLYKYENKTLLERSLDNIDGINFYRKQVVLREDKKELQCIKKLENSKLWKIIMNSNAHLGQSQGVRLGVENLNSDESMMFFTGDQPLITKEVILTIIKSYFKEGGITIPYVGEQSYSPLIFPYICKERLKNIDGDRGGKSILKEEDNINKIYFVDKRVFFDVDTQEDLERMKGF